MANSMPRLWLLNVIDLKLRMTIAYSDREKCMWDDLRKRYVMVKTPKLQQLKANIANCKQGHLDVG